MLSRVSFLDYYVSVSCGEILHSVAGFSLTVTNDPPDNYVVADNLGRSQSFGLNANASQIFSLTDTGITRVATSSATTTLRDFAIDNVAFSETLQRGS